MVVGQLVTAIIVQFGLGIALPLGLLAIGPLVIAASNLVLAGRISRPGISRMTTASLVTWAFVLDTLCLTYVLMLSGGASNPFSLLYLVQITLSAVILTKRSTWFLGGLSTLCFGLMFWIYRPVEGLMMHEHGMSLHLIGMWVGFAVAASLIAAFSGKISELLREREASLLTMQEELAKNDRLASLVTLAAGAAHELNTPLATIAVVAKELERYATKTIEDPALAEDSRLIRSEVDRCREILWRMSVQGAEPAAQAAERLDVRGLLDAVLSEIPDPARLRFEIEQPLPVLNVPRRAVEQALLALVKNAFEASETTAEVVVAVRQSAGLVRFQIIDHGTGMPPEILRRIGEPFFTTKQPGKGMGLGTFLVRMLAEQLGGRLTFQSSPGGGTSATLELPAAAREPVYAHE